MSVQHPAKLLVLIFALAAMSNSYAQSISRSQLGSSFDIRYGIVEDVLRVKVASQAPQGAIMGGLIGGATSGHSHRGKHALEGALAGALLASVLDRKKKAYQYLIGFEGGGETKVITESGGIREGDCVAVELGQTANVRRVSNVHCEHTSHEALAEPIVYASRQQEAAECQSAKDLVLQAQSEDAMNLAMKKVQVFCES